MRNGREERWWERMEPASQSSKRVFIIFFLSILKSLWAATDDERNGTLISKRGELAGKKRERRVGLFDGFTNLAFLTPIIKYFNSLRNNWRIHYSRELICILLFGWRALWHIHTNSLLHTHLSGQTEGALPPSPTVHQRSKWVMAYIETKWDMWFARVYPNLTDI